MSSSFHVYLIFLVSLGVLPSKLSVSLYASDCGCFRLSAPSLGGSPLLVPSLTVGGCFSSCVASLPMAAGYVLLDVWVCVASSLDVP